MKPKRLYFKRGGKLHYTEMPLRHYSLITSFGQPDVVCVFSDGRRWLSVKYSDLAESSRRAWPLPAHVQEVLDEQTAIAKRNNAMLNFSHVDRSEYEEIRSLEDLPLVMSVFDVVRTAVEAGKAHIYSARGGLYVVYDDPLFGEPVDILHLAYNREVGLHVREAKKNEHDLRDLMHRIERWARLAAMTRTAEVTHGEPSKTAYLRPWRAMAQAWVDRTRGELLEVNPAFPPKPDYLYDTAVSIMAILPRIVSPDEFYTLGEQDHEA